MSNPYSAPTVSTSPDEPAVSITGIVLGFATAFGIDAGLFVFGRLILVSLERGSLPRNAGSYLFVAVALGVVGFGGYVSARRTRWPVLQGSLYGLCLACVLFPLAIAQGVPEPSVMLASVLFWGVGLGVLGVM